MYANEFTGAGTIERITSNPKSGAMYVDVAIPGVAMRCEGKLLDPEPVVGDLIQFKGTISQGKFGLVCKVRNWIAVKQD